MLDRSILLAHFGMTTSDTYLILHNPGCIQRIRVAEIFQEEATCLKHVSLGFYYLYLQHLLFRVPRSLYIAVFLGIGYYPVPPHLNIMISHPG